MSCPRALVVIPVYGHHEVTHALLADLEREKETVDVVIVDNRGDYPARGDETVLRPGTNLGWAGGTNFGTTVRREEHHAAVIWLNNDTRLAAGFVSGLFRSWRATGAGLVGPFYDCHWRHQRVAARPSVTAYRARAVHYRAPFIDGTCMFVPATTIDKLGLLDADTFAPLGWGAEIDYCLQVRSCGLDVVVTRSAYLHHERCVTAQALFEGGRSEYFETAYPVQLEGLGRKWGADWPRESGVDPVMSQTTALTRRDRVPRFRQRLARSLQLSRNDNTDAF